MPSQGQSRPQRHDDTPDEAPEPYAATPEAAARKDAPRLTTSTACWTRSMGFSSQRREFVRGFVQKGWPVNLVPGAAPDGCQQRS